MSHILFTPSIEPLSPNAEGQLGEMRLANSQAYRELYRELLEYCRGNISGRSILVSGHRGSGKTTMVHKAIQKVRAEARKHQVREVLVVEVHGPSLLTPLEKPTSPPSKGGQEVQEPADRHTVDALMVLTLALYRCFSKEIVKKFRRHGVNQSLVARLDLDLENAATSRDLAVYWRKAGFLQGADNQGYKELVALDSASQAYRKVIGIISDTETEDRSSEKTATQEANLKSQEVAKSIKPFFKELWSLVAGAAVAGGILIGEEMNGLMAAVGGLLAAVLTSLTFSYTYKRTRTQTYKRDITFIRDTSINTLNRELPLLMKRLKEAGYAPVFVVDELDKFLIGHDKVEFFQERISALKHLIADRSFFCFLTDRNYFDYLSDLIKKKPYPIEQTLFSRRLFVAYNSADFHDYLFKVVQLNPPAETEAIIRLQCFLILGLFHARYHVGDLKKYIESYVEAEKNGSFQLRIPSNIVNDLREEMDTSPTAVDTYYPASEQNRSPYAIQITIQLAIEYMLGDKNSRLKVRLHQEPSFSQVVYDTLYYPVRSWQQGIRKLEITQEAFRTYLEDRMRSFYGLFPPEEYVSPRKTTTNEPGKAQDQSNPQDKIRGFLNDLDFSFLYNQLTRLVQLLQNPTKLQEALLRSDIYRQFYIGQVEGVDARKLWEQICRDIITDNELITLRENRVYSWNYDFHGRKLNPELDKAQEQQVYLVERSVTELDEVLQHLQEGLFGIADETPREENLCERFIREKILNHTINSSEHQDLVDSLTIILRKIKDYRNTGVWYPALNAHVALLDQQWINIELLARLITRVFQLSSARLQLAHSYVRAPFNSHAYFMQAFYQIMDELVDSDPLPLGFSANTSEIELVKNRLESVLAAPSLSEQEFMEIPPLNRFSTQATLQTFTEWKQALAGELAQVSNGEELPITTLTDLVDLHWQAWFDRFEREYFEDRSFERSAINFIFSPTEDMGIMQDLDWTYDGDSTCLNKQDISNREWTKLLIRANLDTIITDANYVPFWLTIPAMVALGLFPSLTRLRKKFETYLSSIQSDDDPEKEAISAKASPQGEEIQLKNLFIQKDLASERQKIQTLFDLLDQRLSKKVLSLRIKLTLLITEAAPEFGKEIDQYAGLIIMTIDDLRELNKVWEHNSPLLFCEFSKIIAYVTADLKDTVIHLLPEQQQSVVEHILPVTATEKADTKETTRGEKAAPKQEVMGNRQLFHHLSKTIQKINVESLTAE